MKAYVSVLDDVICLNEIRKIQIKYCQGSNYHNGYIHTLHICYKNGTSEHYKTDDYQRARKDYEALKSALLELDVTIPETTGDKNGCVYE